MRTTTTRLSLLILSLHTAFAFHSPTASRNHILQLNALKISELPTGISPFEKANAKNSNISEQLRQKALTSLQQALQNKLRLLEIDFPPLLAEGKTLFDDFDNVQELTQNVNWCVELLPALCNSRNVWFVLPDTKEVQLAKEEWTGQRYRQAPYTTIQAVVEEYNAEYSKPWGATFADAMQSLTSNNVLGDASTLDDISNAPRPSLHFICQPGNGGPVEDWINCETLHNNSSKETSTVIVNGALDKVRDGYYPAVFFPKLAATVDRFYRNFEPLLILKPISNKGVYGWLYRVYPEVCV